MRDALHAADAAAMHRTLPPDLFAGLLAISADAVIAVDDEQRIIFFNEGAERIFGWSAAEVGGRYLEMLLPERYRAAHRGHVHGFGAAHGRARLMGERQHISALRRSGEEFAAEASIQRLEVGGRNIYATVLRDISARRQVEEALQRAVQARDDMIGVVSHDLRNPANAVKMLAGALLRGREELPPGARAQVEVIRQASEQIDALIEDLLDFTRIAAGRLVVAPSTVDASVLLSRAIDALRPLADAAGLTITVDVPAGLPAAWADAERVTQLLSNVVGNAIKFTPTGGRVYVRAARAGDDEGGAGMLLFSVADTGPGIADAQMARVFDRFYQAPQATGSERLTSRHGAGLGLPIARGIVEAHGGRIWIERAAGPGTTVRFTLRVAKDEGEY
jgi:PAS domain S-box-containing protein